MKKIDSIKKDEPIVVKVESRRRYKIIGDAGIYSGTSEYIVSDMRFWDTGVGSVTSNLEYMEFVSKRINALGGNNDFPVIKDETEFLMLLYVWGFVELFEKEK